MPTVTFIYDRKKTATRSRGAVIEIRISYDYKKKYLSPEQMAFRDYVLETIPMGSREE